MKHKHEVVWVKAEEESPPHLCWKGVADDDLYKIIKGPEPTAKELADFADHNCEDANYHNLCGLHRKLLAEWQKKFPDQADALMRNLVLDLGGLEILAFENGRW